MLNLKTGWFLILDNADNPDFDYQGYFLSRATETIIMTSWVTDCSLYRTIGSKTLINFSQEKCVKLIFKAVKISVTEWSFYIKAVKNIVDDLSFYILAIM